MACLAAGMGFVRLRAGQGAGPPGEPSAHDPAILP
jgi:hypothetical protein